MNKLTTYFKDRVWTNKRDILKIEYEHINDIFKTRAWTGLRQVTNEIKFRTLRSRETVSLIPAHKNTGPDWILIMISWSAYLPGTQHNRNVQTFFICVLAFSLNLSSCFEPLIKRKSWNHSRKKGVSSWCRTVLW